MIEVTGLPEPWQVRFRAGSIEGRADTRKHGLGGSTGLRPHELLEAALASCMAISARMALADLGVVGDVGVTVRVDIDRSESASRFRYELELDPALEPHRSAVLAAVERSPVRTTLSRQLVFEAASVAEPTLEQRQP